MATVRIYKVAELLGLSSQDAMNLLKQETGIDVKSASSSIEEIVARQFVERQARKRQIVLPGGPLFADTAAAKKPGQAGGKAAPEPPKPAVAPRAAAARQDRPAVAPAEGTVAPAPEVVPAAPPPAPVLDVPPPADVPPSRSPKSPRPSLPTRRPRRAGRGCR